MKKNAVLLLSFLLCASQAFPVYGEEAEVPENTEEVSEITEEEPEVTEEELPVSENEEPEEQEVSEEEPDVFDVPEETEPELPEAPEETEEEGSVPEEETSEEVSEEPEIFLFELSEEEKTIRKQMAENQVLDHLRTAEAGVDYVSDEVVMVTDDIAYAEAAAAAYGGVVERFDGHVAVIKLTDEDVYFAVEEGMDPDSGLPPVDANWIVYLDDPEIQEETEEKARAQALAVPEKTDWEYWVETLESPDPLLKEVSWTAQETLCWQWYHETIGTYQAWGVTTGDPQVIVGVIDSGVQEDHEELAGKVTLRQVSDISTLPSNGHGTHVAGIIAGELGNGKGGAGIAPDVSIYSYNVFRGSGAAAADIASAILLAAEDGVWIANMSFGTVSYSAAVQQAVNTAYEAGVTLIAAMGNYGTNVKCYPAAYEHVIAVGAVTRNNTVAAYSGYGDWCDVSAPGSEISSSYYNYGSVSGYRVQQGTSMASPVIAGSAALYMSSYGHVSPDEMETVLKKNVVSVSGQIGTGIISLKTLFGQKESAPLISFDSETRTLTLTKTAEDERALLVYTLNGKNPAVKSGQVTSGTEYTGPVDLSGKENGKVITVKAAVISGTGVISETSSLKIMIPEEELSVTRKKITALTLVNTELKLNYCVNDPGTAVIGVKKITLEDGSTVSLDDYSENDYQWYSSNEAVVKVDQAGTVTAAGKGSAYVYLKIKFQNTEKKVRCKVTVRRLADSVTVKGREGIISGKSLQMKATVLPKATENKKVTWSVSEVSDPEYTQYASITKDGLLKTKKGIPAGTVITVKASAKDGSGSYGTYQVTVCKKATSVRILKEGEKVTKATLLKADLPETFEADNELCLTGIVSTSEGTSEAAPVWTSSKPKVAKVDSSGVVTALSKGTTVITCKASDGTGLKATVKVTVKVPTSGVFLTVPNANWNAIDNQNVMTLGKTCQLKAAVGTVYGKPDTSAVKWNLDEAVVNGYTVTEEVKEKGLVTVSSTGLVSVSSKLLTKLDMYGLSSGYIIISAETRDGTGHRDECRLWLREKVTEVKTYILMSGGKEQEIGNSTITVSQNKSITVYADYDKRPQAVTVSSANADICGARVNTITKKGDGYRAEIKITGGLTAGTSVITIKENGSGIISPVKIRTKEAE